MHMIKTLGVAAVAALTLGACATRDDIAQINTRLDSIDAQVQSAAQNAQAANQSAQQANQRLNTIESRVQALESGPARTPRG
jgi:murein lipoprotein